MSKPISNRAWTRIELGFDWPGIQPRTGVAEPLVRQTKPLAQPDRGQDLGSTSNEFALSRSSRATLVPTMIMLDENPCLNCTWLNKITACANWERARGDSER